MPSSTVLTRIVSVTIAVLTLAATVAGWGLVGVIEAAARLAPGLETAVDPSHDLMDVADATLDELEVALDSAEIMTGQVSDSTAQVADVVEVVADLTTGQIAGTLTALEASLPALADTAAVIDDSMRALSIFGVDYDPSVPLDEAIADVSAQMEGLPEALSAQGAHLESLTPQLRATGEEVDRLGASLANIRDDLATANETVEQYRGALDEIGGSAAMATRVSTWLPVIRVGLVLVAMAGLVLALAVWGLASRWQASADGSKDRHSPDERSDPR